jgi:hypothetical protein
MTQPPLGDDRTLLDELRTALAEAGEVPAEFLAAGRTAYAWHGIDAELALAEVVFDSAYDAELATRAAHAGAGRMVSFQADDVTVDIEVAPDGITGQVTPAEPCRVSGQGAIDTFDETTADAAGLFALGAPPPGPIRLRVAYADRAVTTDWITVPGGGA